MGITDLRKPKTRRGKRFLENRQPKVIENDKIALMVKGGKTSEVVSGVLSDLHALKKPLTVQLKRHNPVHPFEDDVCIEQFALKYDTSLFVFGSNSKKHPNSLIFGRLHDYHVLDMIELRVESYIRASDFNVPKVTLGCKPCIILQGSEFQSDNTFRRVGNLMVDWFRGAVVENISLQGLELVISLTLVQKKLLLRVFRTELKKSTTDKPRVELIEIGPRIDFSLQRTKLASDSLYRSATKQPPQILAKRRKNLSTDVFGTELGRIHVGKQNIHSLQTRKMKGLRKTNVKTNESEQ